MQCVNRTLQPVSAETEMQHLSRFSFICHSREKTFAARIDELYYVPDEDSVYHRHAVEFFRAIMIMPNGVLRISTLHSVAENVLQATSLCLSPESARPGRGGLL